MNSARRENIKIGRNDPCHCGSHLKYKKCCLRSDEISAQNESLSQKEIKKIKEIQVRLKENVNKILGSDKKSLFINPDKKMIKMSEVILEFADEFLQKMHTKNQKKRVLDLACLAWNIGVFSEKTGQLPDLDEVINMMGVNDNEKNEKIEAFKYILSVLANKKLTEYSSIDRIIVNYKISDDGEDFRIDIMSMVSQKEISMLKINPARLINGM